MPTDMLADLPMQAFFRVLAIEFCMRLNPTP
jgi:hypothetical protein